MFSQKSQQLRQDILRACVACGGHIASSLSCIDILIALYHGKVLRIDPCNPREPSRDRFILSKGHAETALFVTLADRGFYGKEWLSLHYRKGDCRLGGHPDKSIPGVEISSGSLGHGLGIACGMAKAAQLSGRKHHYFVLMGDAECTEGSVWEAALFAAKHALSNVTVIVDVNNIGSIDFTNNFTSLEPFQQKWDAFNWQTCVCDGHSVEKLIAVLSAARQRAGTKPLVILAQTIKGKGISFMENQPMWHVKRLTDLNEIAQAEKELGSVNGI